jgi:hypothetical protein
MLIGVADGLSVTLSNVGTICPRCGGPAHFAEGTLRVESGKFRVLNAPTVTREMLLRLKLLAEEAERRPSKIAALQKRAEKLHPGFGELFAPGGWSPEVKAAIIIAIGAVAAAKLSPSPTVVVAPRLVIETSSPKRQGSPDDNSGRRPLPISRPK